MALYDRFGRLMYGSESTPQDVLDFIVFEKHLSDSYGKWRIHTKITPEWKKGEPHQVPRTLSFVKEIESSGLLPSESKDANVSVSS